MFDILISGLITGNTYALVALGLALIFGIANLVNFAHGSVFAVGAMLAWWFVAVLGLPLWVSVPAVVAATAALGVLIERLAIRPLANAPPIAPLLSTVAVSLILDQGSQFIFSPETRRLPSLLPTNNFQIGGMHFGSLDLAILGVSLLSVAVLWLFLRYSKLGRAVRATAQDRGAALQMGVNVDGVQALAFGVASGLAGLAGLLVGMYYGSVEPTVGFNVGIAGFTAAVLGGLNSLPGAVAGGLILGVVESVGVSLFGGSARQLISFGILVLVLWLRPNGLFGSAGVALHEPLTGTFFGRGQAIRLKRWHAAALVILAAVVLPAVGSNYWLQVGSLVAIFATLALSLTLVSGTAGQVSLGQAGLFAIGAYTSALLTKNAGWPFWLALPASGLMAALCGAVLVAPSLKLRGHYVSMVTLGVGAMITSAILNLEGITRGPLGITNIPPPVILGYAVETPRAFYLLALAVLLACTGLVVVLQRSHLGRGWRGIRDDEVAARSAGVPAAGYKKLAFALAAFVAGLAGSLLAHQYTFISPDIFGVPVSVLALTIVVLGGMSNPLGTILAAAVLIGAPELFRPLQDVRMLGYGLLLLLLIRFRPQGLLGIT